MLNNNEQLTEHFNKREFECRCCHDVKVSSKLVEELEYIRQYLDAPIIILSGYRCEKHNKEVGGLKNSLHTMGAAADFYAIGKTQDEVINVIEALYCEGKVSPGEVIKYANRGFIHYSAFGRFRVILKL